MINPVIYIAPEGQKYLFASTNIRVALTAAIDGNFSKLENATFNFNEAKSRNVPGSQSTLSAETPLIAVFQGTYDGLPQNVPVSEQVALLSAPTHDEAQLDAEISLASQSILGLNPLQNIRKIAAMLGRVTINNYDQFPNDIEGKIIEYNSIARFYERIGGTAYVAYVADGKLMPTNLAQLIIDWTSHLTDSVPKLQPDAPFQARWDYVKDHNRVLIPSDQKIDEMLRTQFSDNALNYIRMAYSMKTLKEEHGLTEDESSVYNGLAILGNLYKNMLKASETIDVLSKTILTPEDVLSLQEHTTGKSRFAI